MLHLFDVYRAKMSQQFFNHYPQIDHRKKIHIQNNGNSINLIIVGTDSFGGGVGR